MSLPRQVERQLREAEEMEKQLAAELGQGGVPPDPEAPAADPEATPPAADANPDQPIAPPAPAEDWQQKYNTLRGMYNAEVPRLHDQVKQLTTQMQALTEQLNAKPAATPAPEPQTLVTDKDVETFGKDLIDLQRRVTAEVTAQLRSEMDAITRENETLKAQVAQTGTRIGEMTFEQRLHRALPDFDQINVDPRWVAWLDEVDPILRSPRRTVAQTAFDEGDVDAIVHYVNLFKQVTGTAGKQADKRQEELNRQVAPPRTAAGAATPTPQGKVYSVAQWGAQYNRVAALNAQGRYDEAKQLEAELDAAVNENRVTA